VQSVLVVYSVRALHLDPAAVGIAVTAGGVIGLLGVAVSGAIHRRARLGPVLAATFALPGVATALVTAIPPGRTPFLGIAAIALLNGIWSVAVIVNVSGCETLKQVTVPPDLLGRFSASVRLLTWGIDPIGALLAAALLTVVDLRTAFVLLGIGLAASGMWIVSSRRLMEFGTLGRAGTAREA
jgi:predicted MFS family arabinose efflux permease